MAYRTRRDGRVYRKLVPVVYNLDQDPETGLTTDPRRQGRIFGPKYADCIFPGCRLRDLHVHVSPEVSRKIMLHEQYHTAQYRTMTDAQLKALIRADRDFRRRVGKDAFSVEEYSPSESEVEIFAKAALRELRRRGA